MELKSLILGLFPSTGAFALKSGGGLAYVLVQRPGKMGRCLVTLAFMTGYGLVFGLAALLLLKVDLPAHMDLFQEFFKSGMTLHFLLAFLLLFWGVSLLKQSRKMQGLGY